MTPGQTPAITMAGSMPHSGPASALDTGQRLSGPHFRGMAEAFAWFEQRRMFGEIREALGKFLDERFLFTHFVTLTLRDKTAEDGNRSPAGRSTLNAAWREFAREARKSSDKVAPAGIRIVEYQRRGVPHIHALTITPGLYGAERKLADHLWDEFGKARVSRFRQHYGAAAYLGKYLAKDARVELTAFGRLHHFERTVLDSDPGLNRTVSWRDVKAPGEAGRGIARV